LGRALGKVRLHRGQWVKGAKAGRNAGRRQECLPHMRGPAHEESCPAREARPTVAEGKGLEANHRQDCRCGKPGDLLHGGAGVVRRTARSTEGSGCREECLPHKRRPDHNRTWPPPRMSILI